MITKAYGAALAGIDPFLVTVETEIQRGIPKFDVVGLAQGAVKEGKNRIVSALRASGVEWRAKRVVVNLAPASVPKEGAALDLPIALGLCAALGVFPPRMLEHCLALGELSLDGKLRPIRGALSFAGFAQKKNLKSVILPQACEPEIAEIHGIKVLIPRDFAQLLAYLQGKEKCNPPKKSPFLESTPRFEDWNEVGGQLLAKRALEIAAAGHHNILLSGPPGIGKTLLASRLPSILPELDARSRLEVQKIYSVCNQPREAVQCGHPPFRSPHHNASLGGMIGGGRIFRPGEFTLAHQGVLFLDELPEFRRDVIEALREPLENGWIRISRAQGVFALPAKFLFVGAMNPCPCGALGDPKKICICTPQALHHYQSKISRPIQDRIDLVVELTKPSWKEIWTDTHRESSASVKQRVKAACNIQKSRNQKFLNGLLSSRFIRELANLDYEGEKFLEKAVERFDLSVRRMDKVLRVARTIADLEDCPVVSSSHLAEALQFRFRGQD